MRGTLPPLIPSALLLQLHIRTFSSIQPLLIQKYPVLFPELPDKYKSQSKVKTRDWDLYTLVL